VVLAAGQRMQIGVPQLVDRIQFFHPSLQRVVVMVELKQLLEEMAVLVVV
jgi:hypothetical protein